MTLNLPGIGFSAVTNTNGHPTFSVSVFSYTVRSSKNIVIFYAVPCLLMCFLEFQSITFSVLKQSNRPCELIHLHHGTPIILHTQTNTQLFGVPLLSVLVWNCFVMWSHMFNLCFCHSIRFGKFTMLPNERLSRRNAHSTCIHSNADHAFILLVVNSFILPICQ